MGVRIRYRPNRAGIAEIGRSPEMQDAMEARALAVRTHARGIAPVDTGNYRAQITASSGVAGGKAFGKVRARANYSVWLEFGTSKMAAFRTLGKALRAVIGG